MRRLRGGVRHPLHVMAWLGMVLAAGVGASAAPTGPGGSQRNADLPLERRLGVIRDLIETRKLWVIFEGDSFAVVGNSHNRLPSETYGLGLWTMGPYRVTAWQLQHRAGGDPPVLCHVANGLLGTPLMDETVEYLADDVNRWSVSCTFGQALMDGVGSLDSAGTIMSFTDRPSSFAPAIPGPLWANGDSDGLACRLLYYASPNKLNDRDIRRHDKATLASAYIDTVNLTSDARGLWHLGEAPALRGDSGAPIYGQVNAIYPDVLLFDTNNEEHTIRLIDAASWPSGGPDPGGDLYTDFSSLWYEANDDGSGHPQWVEGNQLTIVAGSSWDSFGFTEGRAPTHDYYKTFTPEMLTQFLDVSAVSRELTPVFIMYVALDEVIRTTYPAPGDMSDPAVVESVYRHYIEMRESACQAIGLPAPYFLLLMPHYHATASGPIGGGTPEQAKQLVSVVGDVMDQLASESGRIAYFSLMEDTDQVLFDGGQEALDWLTNHGYDAWSPGGGYGTIDLTDPSGEAGNLLDPSKLHPRDANAARFFAERLKRGVVAAPPTCAGDVNGDGVTDVFDFGRLATDFGATGLGPYDGADLDGDGDVDVFDFGAFATGFGCGVE